LRTLLDQSMAPGDYEVVLVDDGSTDATPARLDALATAHPHVRVEHIANSGWPGKPRNVGIEMARGEYVYFVDNDDWLGREALERLYATALRDDADIVVGKVVGQGKTVPRRIFEANRRHLTVEWTPLLGLLTPHKLFRKALLDEHAIRFPEGARRLEDHAFVMRAYFHARSISILADYPCYHWVQPAAADNASVRPFDPAGYYANVREVLDVVVAHTEPGPFREELLAHWYRGKMLARVGSRNFARRDPAYRRALYDEIRALALERYDESVDELLAFNLQVRSRLLRRGAYAALEALAEMEATRRARATLRNLRREGRDLVLDIDGRLRGPDGPFVFTRAGERLVWEAPEAVRRVLVAAELDASTGFERTPVQVFLRSLEDRAEYLLPTRASVRLVPLRGEPDRVKAVVDIEARVQPATAAGGSPLPPGEWEVLAAVTVAGFRSNARVRRKGESEPLRLRSVGRGRIGGAGAAEPPPWLRIADRLRWRA
jgi:glycosyltransferase involved in cell wall biosynthesis